MKGKNVAIVVGVIGVGGLAALLLSRRAAAASLGISISPTSFPTRDVKGSATPITITIENTSTSPIWRIELFPIPTEGVIVATIPYSTNSQWDIEYTGEWVETAPTEWTAVTAGERMVAKEGYAIQPGEVRDISLGVIGAEVPSNTQWIIECENTEGDVFTKSIIMETY